MLVLVDSLADFHMCRKLKEQGKKVKGGEKRETSVGEIEGGEGYYIKSLIFSCSFTRACRQEMA